jgi:hypothetical protein
MSLNSFPEDPKPRSLTPISELKKDAQPVEQMRFEFIS